MHLLGFWAWRNHHQVPIATSMQNKAGPTVTIFPHVVETRKQNETIYKIHQEQMEGLSISLGKALKMTECKAKDAMELVQTPKLSSVIEQLCEAQEFAQKAEADLNWVSRFKKPTADKGPKLTDAICEAYIDTAKAALDDIIVNARCLKAVLPK